MSGFRSVSTLSLIFCCLANAASASEAQPQPFPYFTNIFDAARILTPAAIGIISALIAMYYLRFVNRLRSNKSDASIFSEAELLLSSRSESISRKIESEIVNKTLKNIDDKINDKIGNNVKIQIGKKLGDNVVDYIGSEILQKAKDLAINDKLIDEITTNLRADANRLIGISERRSKYASHVSYAALTLSFIGVSALILILYRIYFSTSAQTPAPFSTEHIMVYSYQYSFAIFCEIIAAILFRNGSKSLELARYFSNEASNVDIRLSAIIISIRKPGEEHHKSIIDALIRSDRNAPIGTDKRTYEQIALEAEDRNFENISKILTLLKLPESKKTTE